MSIDLFVYSNIQKKPSVSRPKGKSSASGTGILPPPPGSSNVKLPAPPVKAPVQACASSSSSNSTQQQDQETPANLEESDDKFMAEFDKLSVNQAASSKPDQTTTTTGEGTGENSSSLSQNAVTTSPNSGWAQF